MSKFLAIPMCDGDSYDTIDAHFFTLEEKPLVVECLSSMHVSSHDSDVPNDSSRRHQSSAGQLVGALDGTITASDAKIDMEDRYDGMRPNRFRNKVEQRAHVRKVLEAPYGEWPQESDDTPNELRSMMRG